MHPNGIIRICSLLIGTPYGIARFYEGKIVWDESPTNELRGHELDQDTPCTNQNKGRYFGNFVPLCVSFKPRQKELIWEQKLEFDSPEKTFIYTDSKGYKNADEWFRVRISDKNSICYKKWYRDKNTSKSLYADEIEIGVEDGRGLIALLENLGFKQISVIGK